MIPKDTEKEELATPDAGESEESEKEIPEEAWDSFEDLMDTALGVEKEEPPAQDAG